METIYPMPAEIYVSRIDQPSHRIPGRLIDDGVLALALALVVSDTVTRSYFSIIFFGDASFGAFLVINFWVILLFVGIAALRGDIFILVVFFGIAAFFLCYYLYFIIGAGRPLNFNPLGGYYGALTVIVFYQLAVRKLLPSIMKMIFLVYAAYLVAYAILALAGPLGLDVSFASEKAPVDLSDPDRENRLSLYQAAAIYVAAYSVSQLKERIHIGYILTFSLAAAAAFLSMTRTLMICSVLVFILYLSTVRMKLVQWVSFVGSLLTAAYLMYGIFDPGFNPYWFGANDESTLARKYQFDIVAEYVRNAPIFGIGLPDADEGLTYYLGKVIYPPDLAIVGIWFQFGIVGVVWLGIAPVYVSCIQDVKRCGAHIGEVNARTLALAGCIMGLIGGEYLYTVSALLFSLILANKLYIARVGSKASRQGRSRLVSGVLRPRL